MTMSVYRVVVSNLDSPVYEGENARLARDEFTYYARASLRQDGRVAGACVAIEGPSGRIEFDPAKDQKVPKV